MATLISPIFERKYKQAIVFSGDMTLADEANSQQVFAEATSPLVVEDNIVDTKEEATKWLLEDNSDVQKYLTDIDGESLAMN